MLNHFVLESKAPRNIPDKHSHLKERLTALMDNWTELWSESYAFKKRPVVEEALAGQHLNRATFARIMKNTQ
jgi:hypothetical protein